jgi:tRNA A37 threonylcarbamoyladenosine dehydratase
MKTSDNPIFHRLQLVTGRDGLAVLEKTRVIIFGVGGVGSWTAESLIRSGIGHLTIVDSDLVCVTNINRQVQATTGTVGHPKVEALKERLHAINPAADIVALETIYDKETAAQFDLDSFDYVIDAIDSLSCKLELIANAVNADTTLFSSLGAACKLDPTRVRVAPIWKTRGCRLGRFVRKRLRNRGVTAPFICVYSDELRPPQEGTIGCGTGNCACPKKQMKDGELVDAHEWCSSKQQINGSAVHITGIFGFTLCGLVMQDVLKDIKAIRPLS